MPYKDGNPTLGEQIEEDQRREFYTREILKEAREDRDEIRELRGSLAELVQIIEKAGLNNLSNGVQLGQTAWYVKANYAMERANAALNSGQE